MSQPREPKAFLGVGWAFPFEVTADGAAATVRHEQDIEQAIRILLGTNPGERVMRPDFGSGLEEFLFEPITVSTLERIKRRVRDALIDHEARIDVENVTTTPAGAPPNRIDIGIEYRVRTSNALHNLVYPFYLGEGAGGAP